MALLGPVVGPEGLVALQAPGAVAVAAVGVVGRAGYTGILGFETVGLGEFGGMRI